MFKLPPADQPLLFPDARRVLYARCDAQLHDLLVKLAHQWQRSLNQTLCCLLEQSAAARLAEIEAELRKSRLQDARRLRAERARTRADREVVTQLELEELATDRAAVQAASGVPF